jgi:hypothetical protein
VSDTAGSARTPSNPFVDPRAATVITAIRSRAALIESSVDLIALTVEPLGQAILASRLRTVGLAIESTVDAITLPIETLLDSIAAIVQALFDAVTGVGPRRSTGNEKQQSCQHCFPDIHIEPPLYPYDKCFQDVQRKERGSVDSDVCHYSRDSLDFSRDLPLSAHDRSC